MKNKFFGISSFVGAVLFAFLLVATVLFPVFVFAEDSLENYLRSGEKEDIRKLTVGLLNLLDKNFVGIGLEFFEANDIMVDGKKPVVGIVIGTLTKGPAEKAGIKSGNIILSVNGKPYASEKEFKEEVLGNGIPGRKVVLELLDGADSKYISRRVVEMKTAFFGISEDKRSAAEDLRFAIITEGAFLATKYDNLILVLSTKLENPVATLNEKDKQEFYNMLDDLSRWYNDKIKQIESLKAPQ